jgi:hypothetical protein|tara:strand:- start:28 stop:630 length:603 start_codon:yes stop_codon:yes gene_type:complete
MAMFGSQRDISLFRNLNRELMGDIITQQCAFYKFKLEETKVNLYGESAEEKYYMGPVLLNCVVERDDQFQPETELGTDFTWNTTFKFLRDDLLGKGEDFNVSMSYTEGTYRSGFVDNNVTSSYGADLVPEVGDIILYQEGYYEVDDISANQYFVGKNPDYPNSPNPYNPGLDEYGWNTSIIVKTHYVPADKVGITRERYL